MKTAICHPDRKHHARGLCLSCYVKMRYAEKEHFKPREGYPKRKPIIPTCHPNRKHYGHGLCQKCYSQSEEFIARRLQNDRNWRERHVLEKRIKDKVWRESQEGQAYRKQYNRIYKREKRKTDIQFRILEALRGRVSAAIKSNRKSEKTKELLGCSLDFFKNYLEFKFQPKMTWENYGKWHIDHIRPCCSFDLSKKEEQKECFHYTNMQPLWALDNIQKGGKFFEETIYS